MTEPMHVPVMLTEAVEGLRIQEGRWYIDATFGRGGHTKEMLERGANVIAIDQDSDAIAYAEETCKKEMQENRLMVKHINFDKLGEMPEISGKEIAGVLFDFGPSSIQLDTSARGFSFQSDAPLDMRMDSSLAVTAKDLVNGLGKRELYELLTTYAQEYKARAIVDAILRARSKKPIETTRELAKIVERAVGHKRGHLHPATKTFMALRMAVNDELGSIERALPTALDVLSGGGRLVTISFHEGEDRLVKTAMKRWEAQGKGVIVTKKPMTPSEREVQGNPRSRSAKLRIFEKGVAS